MQRGQLMIVPAAAMSLILSACGDDSAVGTAAIPGPLFTDGAADDSALLDPETVATKLGNPPVTMIAEEIGSLDEAAQYPTVRGTVTAESATTPEGSIDTWLASRELTVRVDEVLVGDLDHTEITINGGMLDWSDDPGQEPDFAKAHRQTLEPATPWLEVGDEVVLILTDGSRWDESPPEGYTDGVYGSFGPTGTYVVTDDDTLDPGTRTYGDIRGDAIQHALVGQDVDDVARIIEN